MRPGIRGRLCLPTVLAVTAVGGAPACGGEKTGTETEVSATGDSRVTDSTSDATEVTGTTPTTTSGATMDPTGTGTDAATDTGTDTAGLPDCHAIVDQAECAGEAGCLWMMGSQYCYTDCPTIKDRASCLMSEECMWISGECTLVLE